MTKRYRLKKDYETPCRKIYKGVVNTTDAWKAIIRDLQDEDDDVFEIKDDWFEEIPEQPTDEFNWEELEHELCVMYDLWVIHRGQSFRQAVKKTLEQFKQSKLSSTKQEKVNFAGKKFLFKSYDGHDIYIGDKVYWVNKKTLKIEPIYSDSPIEPPYFTFPERDCLPSDTWEMFAYKEAAEEYIANMGKPMPMFEWQKEHTKEEREKMLIDQQKSSLKESRGTQPPPLKQERIEVVDFEFDKDERWIKLHFHSIVPTDYLKIKQAIEKVLNDD